MAGFVIRVIVTLLIAALLWVQARAAQGQPHRRRGFELAAAALLVFAVFNGSVAVGGRIGVLQVVIGAAGMALFLGAVVSIILSLRSGEIRGQRDRVAAAAQEYRERRSADKEASTRDREL